MTVALETLSIRVLAEIHNLLAEKPVSKFSTKTIALERVAKVLADTNHEVFAVEGAEGEYDVRPIPAPVEEKPAAEVVAPKAEKPAKKAKKAATGNKRGPAPEYSDDMVITALVANPKRHNSASYDRFQLYFIYKTVGEFLTAGGRRADLSWDVEHAFISVTKPSA